MDHLTFEEVVSFVSFDELNDDNLKLAAKVGNHIKICNECEKKVFAVQTMYEEFVRLGKKSQFGEKVVSLADIGLENGEERDMYQL